MTETEKKEEKLADKLMRAIKDGDISKAGAIWNDALDDFQGALETSRKNKAKDYDKTNRHNQNSR